MSSKRQIKIGDDKIEMTEKELLFCTHFLDDPERNATNAAIKSGYARKSARITASRLLTKANISQYLEHQNKTLLEKHGITQSKVLEEIKNIAFNRVTDVFYNDYTLKKPDQLTDEQKAAISQIKSVTDSKGKTTHEIKMYDKIKPLILLAEMAGIINRKGEVIINQNHNTQNNYYEGANRHIKENGQ